MTVASLAWVVALVIRRDDTRVAMASILVMALTGGALGAFATTAIIFPAVAALSATTRWRIPVGAAIAASGWLALVVAELALGAPVPGVILGCLAATLGGALFGIARRQAVEKTRLVARTEVETVRAEVERERAELLSERNHLAREIHDVLAHTLAALSLQLEAFATVVDSEPGTSPKVREQLERTHRLVHEGLAEARGAVRALRDDSAPLDEQLEKLCAQQGARFTVSGPPLSIPPPVALGLYRASQEALTNVMKHATGAPTSVRLSYADDRVSVSVENAGAPGSSKLHRSGGGYGLQGAARASGPARRGHRGRADTGGLAGEGHRPPQWSECGPGELGHAVSTENS